MSVMYNENDPVAAHVLGELIAMKIIADGVVYNCSIKDLRPNDLRGFTQCHFFAGAGVWSAAARLAGWPDDRELWTGSCPCQPFSAAGKGGGVNDPRHLWPDFHRLISARRPSRVMGEQVAGALGYGWFDGVAADLARENYACRGVDIPACAVDAPNIRQRLYWLAMADADRSRRRGWPENAIGRAQQRASAERVDGLVDTFGPRLERQRRDGDGTGGRSLTPRSIAAPDGRDVGDAASDGRPQGLAAGASARHGNQPAAAHGLRGSRWADAEWITCHDGKARRAKPGLRLLVDGLVGRIDLWRLAGNSINETLAAEVIGAMMDAYP